MMVDIGFNTEEKRAVAAWTEQFTPAERAGSYAALWDIALSPQWEEALPSISVLRWGMHRDYEAQRYVEQHPEIFGVFHLNYNWMMDYATDYGYALAGEYEPEKWTPEAVQQSKDEMAVSRKWDNTNRPQTAEEAIAPTVGEGGKLPPEQPEYSSLLPPISQLEHLVRGYMPGEEQLGFDFWPIMLGVSALGLGWFALPAGTVAVATAGAMTAVNSGAMAVQRWWPTNAATATELQQWTARDAASMTWRLATIGAGTNLAGQVAYNWMEPKEAAEYQAEAEAEAKAQILRNQGVPLAEAEDVDVDPVAEAWARSLGDRAANVVSTTINGEPVPEDTDPVDFMGTVAGEATTILTESSVYPDDLIARQGEVLESRMSGEQQLFGAGDIGTQFGVDPQTAAYESEAASITRDAVTWMEDDEGQQGRVYRWVFANQGEEAATQWAVLNYDPQETELVEPRPSPYIGAGVEGSPIGPPVKDPNTGEWSNDPYRQQRTDEGAFPGDSRWNGPYTGPGSPPRYDAADFGRMIGNMTPGQIEAFVEKGIASGLIEEDYYGTGLMDGIISKAFEYVLYQANLSGDPWNVVMDKMVDAYAVAKEEAKAKRLEDWYADFVPSSPYFDLDPDTIAQSMKITMRNELGREPNQWEINMMADGMRKDHRTAYDRQIAAERDVYNAKGRAMEYDDPQTLPTGYEAVDEEAGFAERFEEQYDVELGQMERQEQVQEHTTNLFSGLSQLSRMMGGR